MSHGAPPPASLTPRVTLRTIRGMAMEGRPFSCLTCYDATTARWLARAGVHVLLVGDTAAEMILGFERTIDMPLDVLLALTAGVKRGAPSCMVMGDMPFMSYHADESDAIRNAGRFLTEGCADIVKLEADESFAPLVAKLTRAGIPACGHIGGRPQHVGLHGGYAAAGRTADELRRIVNDAMALEAAGCQMLLVEAVPPEVTMRILEATRVPLIGIGAGPDCHGQVLVLQDLLGMTDKPPRFAEPVASIGPAIQSAAEEWARRVAVRQTGGEPFKMKPGEAQKLSDGEAPRVHLNNVEGWNPGAPLPKQAEVSPRSGPSMRAVEP